MEDDESADAAHATVDATYHATDAGYEASAGVRDAAYGTSAETLGMSWMAETASVHSLSHDAATLTRPSSRTHAHTHACRLYILSYWYHACTP